MMGQADPPARQLNLDLARAPSFDPDDFLVSPSNAEAHAMIEHWPDWPDRALVLLGPSGAGKSHLAAIWAARSGARVFRLDHDLGAILEADPVRVIVEDGDRVGYREADLFHLLNAVAASGGSILLTARKPPDHWGLTTPDVLSRLRRAPLVPILQPDSTLIRSVLVKLFADRQISIAEDVVAYAALHCERSLDAVNRFVKAVDEDALASSRRITRTLAARTLARIAEEPSALDA